MGKRQHANLMTTLLVLALTAMMALAVGCEREEYQPEAVGAAEADDNDGADNTAASAGVTTNSHHYSMRSSSTTVKAGDSQDIELTVLPGSDLKINLDFPWSIEFFDSDDVELGAHELDGDEMDLSDDEAVIPVSVTVTEAGTHRIEAEGNFSVCNDDICHILRGEKVELVVETQ